MSDQYEKVMMIRLAMINESVDTKDLEKRIFWMSTTYHSRDAPISNGYSIMNSDAIELEIALV